MAFILGRLSDFLGTSFSKLKYTSSYFSTLSTFRNSKQYFSARILAPHLSYPGNSPPYLALPFPVNCLLFSFSLCIQGHRSVLCTFGCRADISLAEKTCPESYVLGRSLCWQRQYRSRLVSMWRIIRPKQTVSEHSSILSLGVQLPSVQCDVYIF